MTRTTVSSSLLQLIREINPCRSQDGNKGLHVQKDVGLKPGSQSLGKVRAGSVFQIQKGGNKECHNDIRTDDKLTTSCLPMASALSSPPKPSSRRLSSWRFDVFHQPHPMPPSASPYYSWPRSTVSRAAQSNRPRISSRTKPIDPGHAMVSEDEAVLEGAVDEKPCVWPAISFTHQHIDLDHHGISQSA